MFRYLLALLASITIALAASLLQPTLPHAASSARDPLGGTTATPTLTLTPTPGTGCDPVWSSVTSPTTQDLLAVAALSHYDAWAVGDGGIFRWNGSAWGSVSFPNPPGPVTAVSLHAVAAHQANDVWAAGNYSDGSNTHNIVYHWNGSTWNLLYASLDSPEGGELKTLEGISPTGSGQAIAVGRNLAGGPPTITRCTDTGGCTAMPQPLLFGSFNAVEAGGPSDVWAVGVCSGTSLIEHYDGSSWQPVASPDIAGLTGVTFIAPDDVWAIGANGAIHWDGSTWTQLSNFNGQAAISAIASNDVWSVGYNLMHGANIWHWDGTHWYGAASPQIPLYGVSALTHDDIWAVGYSGYITRERFQQQFEDAPPNSTFYPYIQDLACRAIISGYPCGGPGEPCTLPDHLPYSRPASYVTRGQLSKIVVLAAALPTPGSSETFEDVPAGSTFHLYVEALFVRAAISGYPCGGPGEPCDTTHRPYFRPNATSTRGQIAKIVAITANYTDPFSARTFEDVPTTSTFYLWIENLASRAIINGYPCGGPNESCNPPANRPYFRPANNVTRGQLAKIADITFFP